MNWIALDGKDGKRTQRVGYSGLFFATDGKVVCVARELDEHIQCLHFLDGISNACFQDKDITHYCIFIMPELPKDLNERD